MVKAYPTIKSLRTLYTEDKSATGVQISADGRFHQLPFIQAQ